MKPEICPEKIFEKKTQTPNSIKIRPVGAELFHADRDRQTDRQTRGQIDVKKLTDAFRNFVNAPQN